MCNYVNSVYLMYVQLFCPLHSYFLGERSMPPFEYPKTINRYLFQFRPFGQKFKPDRNGNSFEWIKKKKKIVKIRYILVNFLFISFV